MRNKTKKIFTSNNFCKKSNKIIDSNTIINISALTQPTSYKQGWIFQCYNCNYKTTSTIRCYHVYEIYMCNNCQLKYKNDNKKFNELAKYCRYIANKKTK